MAMKSFADGDVLYAADVTEWLQPKAAYRTSAQSNSTTTLANDNQLSVAVAANAVYRVELDLIYDGGTDGDLKGGWTMPSGATMSPAVASGLQGSAASASDDLVTGASSTPQFGALGAGTNCGASYISLLTTSTASGTLQWQFAQNSASATATRMLAGSQLIAARVG